MSNMRKFFILALLLVAAVFTVSCELHEPTTSTEEIFLTTVSNMEIEPEVLKQGTGWVEIQSDYIDTLGVFSADGTTLTTYGFPTKATTDLEVLDICTLVSVSSVTKAVYEGRTIGKVTVTINTNSLVVSSMDSANMGDLIQLARENLNEYETAAYVVNMSVYEIEKATYEAALAEYEANVQKYSDDVATYVAAVEGYYNSDGQNSGVTGYIDAVKNNEGIMEGILIASGITGYTDYTDGLQLLVTAASATSSTISSDTVDEYVTAFEARITALENANDDYYYNTGTGQEYDKPGDKPELADYGIENGPPEEPDSVKNAGDLEPWVKADYNVSFYLR